jgi:hypothetical protein
MGFLLVVLAIASGHDRSELALASGNNTADFNMVAFEDGIPIKDGCDTFPADYKCTVHPEGTFQVNVYLDQLPTGLPDTAGDPDAIGGYTEAGFRLDYSSNLTFNPLNVSWQWPDCGTEIDLSESQVVNVGCGSGSANASTFTSSTTPMVTLEFTCPEFKTKETITLVYGFEAQALLKTLPFDTVLIDENDVPVTEAAPSETLIINCDNFFPWDINLDNAVSGLDIFEVIGHFGEVKPTP